METKILMAYASTYGSTQEVAEAVAATLGENGLSVDFRPMRKVRTLEEYDAVVLGAAFYFGLWHKDALNFLSRNEDALTRRSLAIFALGPTSKDEKGMQGARVQLDKVMAKFSRLSPVAVEMFGGKYPARLRFPHTLIASLPASPMHGMPATDIRDWTAIRAWANSLVTKFQMALPQ